MLCLAGNGKKNSDLFERCIAPLAFTVATPCAFLISCNKCKANSRNLLRCVTELKYLNHVQFEYRALILILYLEIQS